MRADTFGLHRTSGPATEPVEVAEAKSDLRISNNAEDDLIGSLIMAAREYAESETSRALITQTWQLTLDCFAPVIRLPRPPLLSVTSIEYVDEAGITQTLDPSKYRVDTGFEPGRITPAWEHTWPGTRPVSGAVKITYTAGYGDAENVPEQIKRAMLMLINHWYTNRQTVVVGTITSEVPMATTALLSHYRLKY